MDNERRKRILEILETVLAATPEKQNEVLERACGSDVSLREEVLVRLEIEPSLDLDNPLVKNPLDSPTLPPSYTLIRELGRGGMGVVLLATQEKPVRREVALKLTTRGMNSFRFGTERQILANLNHPHIAKFFDGGETPDGLPFFAMEYVKGTQITEHCAVNNLSVHDCLKLFIQVCHAVEFAHRNLVVHRDIKPGNILVDTEGNPRLLDFGIAKILDNSLGDTVTGLAPMTPEYAAPEQIRGEAITTGTDVYALGVLLYQLLTGCRPYEFERRDSLSISQKVCEEIPKKPSLMITSESTEGSGITSNTGGISKLRRELEGDIDNIVMKALGKEPSARYQSAREFAADLEAHLENRPVTAQAPTITYRLSKFIKRNPLPVAGGIIFAVVVLSFLAIVMNQQQVIAAERDIVAAERDTARKERDNARDISKFLISIFDSQDPNEVKGETLLATDILDRGAERIAVELKNQPVTRAQLMVSLGKIFWTFKAEDKGRKLLEEGLALSREVAPDSPALVTAILENAAMHHRSNQMNEFNSMAKEAYEMAQQLSDSPEELIRSMHLYGYSALSTSTPDDCVQRLSEALTVAEAELPADHALIMDILSTLGLCEKLNGNLEKAKAHIERSIEISEKKYGPLNMNLIKGYREMGDLLHYQGKYAESEVWFRKALELVEKLLDEEHDFVAVYKGFISRSLQKQERFEEAEAVLEELIVQVKARAYGRQRGLGDALFRRAHLYMDMVRLEESEQSAGEALAVYLDEEGESGHNVRATYALIGTVQRLRVAYGDAVQTFEKCREIDVGRYGEFNARVAWDDYSLGLTYAFAGKYALAATHAEKSLETHLKVYGEDNRFTARSQDTLGLAYRGLERYEESEAMFDKTLAFARKQFGADNLVTLQRCSRLVELYLATGRFEDANELSNMSHKLWKKKYPQKNGALLADVFKGACQGLLDDREAGEVAMLEGFQELSDRNDKPVPEKLFAVEVIANYFKEIGNQTEADRYFALKKKWIAMLN